MLRDGRENTVDRYSGSGFRRAASGRAVCRCVVSFRWARGVTWQLSDGCKDGKRKTRSRYNRWRLWSDLKKTPGHPARALWTPVRSRTSRVSGDLRPVAIVRERCDWSWIKCQVVLTIFSVDQQTRVNSAESAVFDLSVIIITKKNLMTYFRLFFDA